MSSLHLVYSSSSAALAETAAGEKDTIVLMSQAVLLASGYTPGCQLLAHEGACKARMLSPHCELIDTNGLVQLSADHKRVITWP